MYLPPHFDQPDRATQHALIRSHPLATLITHGPDGLTANLLPMLVDAGRGPHGTLRAHLARANPQVAQLAAGEQCLVVFQGPAHYISPNWYASKQDTHRVVPTWNFVMLQARGRPRLIDDSGWLRHLLDDLTRVHEAAQPQPWRVADAPPDFIEASMRAIVGLEIPLTSLEGKWKMSQNRPAADRRSVVSALRVLGGEQAEAVAALVAKGG